MIELKELANMVDHTLLRADATKEIGRAHV